MSSRPEIDRRTFTCLPGMTTPITHDESHITALDINSEGHVYGGTSGGQAHLFGAAFHGVTGVVLDAGAIPGSTSTEAICCGASHVIAFVNGPQGGRAVALSRVGAGYGCRGGAGSRPPGDGRGRGIRKG